MLIGIVGKPSAGKSSFLNACCLTDAKVGNYPFTTIEPNRGIATVQKPCPCKELGVEDNPSNSTCIDGIRFIPIPLLDVAGLVPGASQGRGRGNKFLDDLRQADALIHVVDASGSLNAEGEEVKKGSWDPVKDIEFLEDELDAWIFQIMEKDFGYLARKAETEKTTPGETLGKQLSGLRILPYQIDRAVKGLPFQGTPMTKWTEDERLALAGEIRKISKPIIILANKIDQPTATAHFENLVSNTDRIVIPGSSLAEYHLRKLVENKIVDYVPGSSKFTFIKDLPENEKNVLNQIQSEILDKYGSTGIQEVIHKVVYDVLQMVAVYPVEDVNSYSDKNNRVLPDVYLVPKGTNVRSFAGKIHSDFEENFLSAVLAKSKRKLSKTYEVEDGDIIKINSKK